MILASAPPEGTPTPGPIEQWAVRHGYAVDELVWLNELGGITARLVRDGHPALFAKWSPEEMLDEAERVSWLSSRFPAPRTADFEEVDDGSLLVTYAMPGTSAVHFRSDPATAARAMGEGLGRLHSLDPSQSIFGAPGWVGEQDDIDELVVVHGDPCVPNTLVDDAGRFAGIVDLGELGVACKWADLAVASWSLDANFGEGHQGPFWEAYGETPDPERIRRYRDLYHAEG